VQYAASFLLALTVVFESKQVAAVLTALLCAAAAGPGTAREDLTPAQQRLKLCHARAKDKQLEGTERNHFLTACLEGSDGDGRPLTPRERTHEMCNEAARGREGAERRGYMTECEKAPAARSHRAPGETEKDCGRRADGRRLKGEDRRAYLRGCLEAAAEH
jgi:psiF repeat